MGLFDKFKKKESSAWNNAYKANPQFYSKDTGCPLCGAADPRCGCARFHALAGFMALWDALPALRRVRNF